MWHRLPVASRLIRLRYRATCAGCGGALAPKTSAWWNADAKTVRCETCGARTLEGPEAAPAFTAIGNSQPGDSTQIESANAPESGGEERIRILRTSAAGGSAQAEYERRKLKREATIRARHPRLGRLILALSHGPQSTTAWAQGAEGERRLADDLDKVAAAGVAALHDRRIPGSRTNIDHLAVTPSGVWVIDAKHYAGQVEQRDVGGWPRSDLRLYVGRRDCTKLVTGMQRQAIAVRGALGAAWSGVPVRPVLCFVDAQWGWFAKPFELHGVLITWGKALGERLAQPGAFRPDEIAVIFTHLAQTLGPAT